MTKTKFNIIFMGTPDFSVPALKAIAKSGHNVSLVVTQPDRPQGRGRETLPTPIKKTAQSLGLPVIQPENINTTETVKLLKSLEPDLYVVVAFGQKLSEEVLNIPKIYPINIHASLLPLYRGASPIQAAILNMDRQTGITTMVMGKDLDTGDILLSSKTDIRHDETAETLHDRLSRIGGEIIFKTLVAIAENTIIPIPQNHEIATYAPMLNKSDGEINWADPSEKICARIRAMSPWPGAYTYYNEKTLKIFRAEPCSVDKSQNIPGTILESKKTKICVASGNGIVEIKQLIGKSGKRLTTEEFLRGNKLEQGSKFGK